MRNLAYVETFESWADLNCDYYDIIPNMYMISTFGRVMNKQTGLILQQNMINSGYMVVGLRCNGINRKSARFLVHRLMLLTFKPIANPEDYTVNHKDCTKIQNNLFNLEWMTQAENNAYKYKINPDIGNCENNYNSRITNEQARIICEELEKRTRYKDILKKIGYMPTDYNDNMYDLITNIKLGLSWKNISKDYDFSNVHYNGSNYTNEQIDYICQCLSKGMDIGDIYNSMNSDKYVNSRVNKSFYEMVRRIRKHEIFNNISCDYVF